MPRHTFTRTGDLPVSFSGELIARASTFRNQGPGNNRWHDLELYRTDSGRLVARVVYDSSWQGEDTISWLGYAGDPAEFRDAVRARALVGMVGYPPHDSYREKQARNEADLRTRFDVALSELFDGVPELVEEVA